jgi:uncharacterized membrane protein
MQEEIKETSRLEAFSDGVFGFAITLLVLDIRVPQITADQSLFQAIIQDWSTYLSFLIGFFTILICWINHHFMFDYIYKSNSKLLLLNGFKLLVITFTPFATALIAKYIGEKDQQMAVNVYTFNFALMGTTMFIIWYYAYKNNLMKPERQGASKTISHYYFLASAMSITIFLLSFINIWLCLSMSGVMFITFLFPEQMMMYVTKVWMRRSERKINDSMLTQQTGS